jgi:hypothetical protein
VKAAEAHVAHQAHQAEHEMAMNVASMIRGLLS